MRRTRPLAVGSTAAALALLLGFVATSRAEDPAPPAARQVPALCDIAWLEGTWASQTGGDVHEEHWSTAIGGSMLGTFRWIQKSEAKLYELMTLEEDEEGVVLRIRHFGPGLAPWPDEADRPVTLRLTGRDASHAVFEDPAREFPRRITYRIAHPRLDILLEGTSKGEPMEMAFTLERRQPGKAPARTDEGEDDR